MSDFNPFSLTGKTILVTGASSGVGRQVAIECSKSGARIVLTARNEDRLKETLSRMDGDGHSLFSADLTKEEDVNALVASLPSLDGVVLCAGNGLLLPFVFNTRQKYDEVFNINFFAPAELLRQIVKRKKVAKDSSVVFVSSVGGVSVIDSGNSAYGTSKAALNALMKFCARELAPKGIRVNSINPGILETPMLYAGSNTQEQITMGTAYYPLKRYGKPEEVAWGIIYLLSDASAWVTGTSLMIDGGLSI